MSEPEPDPFGTAALRRRVLQAWAASPARFREDANAEEELALGAYRGRLVVELAQNAADAAQLAGVPGRLRLSVRDGVLVAANTGAPLTAAGVESLANLRASAKQDGPDRPPGAAGPVGRFGVGFAAVRAVSDEPAVLSRSGSVRWSLHQARDAIAAVPSLSAEAARRGDALPVLRLPFPAAQGPPAGFDTAVVLPLRDEDALTAVREELRGVDPVLLLSLPALVEVDLDGRRLSAAPDGPYVVVDDDGERTRWRVVRRSGSLPAAVLAARPVQEQRHPRWSVLCAAPVGEPTGPGDLAPVPLPSSVPRVFRAPTPTDEPLSLPVVLAGTWPLDSTRRWLAGGPLRAELLARAAAAYAELVLALAAGPAVLDLVPTGLAAGEVDAQLRTAVLDALADTPFLPLAAGDEAEPDGPEPGGPGRVRPREALAVDLGPAATRLLAGVLANLVPADWASRLAPLAVLGVRRLDWPGVVDVLGSLDRPPAWWGELYAALAQEHLGGPERDALGALPVPLADGRIVRGPRGLFLPAAGLDPAAVRTLHLPVVAPAAAGPLLAQLGAVPGSARALLGDARVAAAVAASLDADEPGEVAEAVLTLVAAAEVAADELPWLADLALPTDDGGYAPAGEMLLPGGALDAVMLPDAPFARPDPDLLDRWGRRVLTAVGVLDGFAVARDADVVVDPAAAEHDLDGEAQWLGELLDTLAAQGVETGAEPPVLAEMLAVRDLELVAADRWAAALQLLPLPALAEPALVLLPDGRRLPAVPYTRWWLRAAPVLSGARPVELAMPGSELVGFYDPAPADLPPHLLRALGVRADWAELLAEPDGPADLLARLAGNRELDRDTVRRLHALLCTAAVDPPDRVRVVSADRTVAVDPREAVVVDAPDLLALVPPLLVVPAPLASAGAVADLLDVPLASELGRYEVRSAGTVRPVPVLAGQRPGGEYVEHARLTVADARGRGRRVRWRVLGGVAHVDAAAGPDALGRALAWRDGRWPDRWYLAALLARPGEAAALAAERDLD